MDAMTALLVLLFASGIVLILAAAFPVAAFAPPVQPVVTPDAPVSGLFKHPRLGVAELRERWDPAILDEPPLPPQEQD